jgi:uncharacterized protein
MSELTNTAALDKSQTAEIEKNLDKGKPYWNPYLSGIGLGLVLLVSFIIMGRGLGASGAFSSVLASGLNTVVPEHVKSNEYLNENFEGGKNPLKDWLVFEVIGVIAGGFISGALAGRIKVATFKGPNTTNGRRLMFALIGGAIMGFGAKLARGCTSGQALTGGALLNLGSWVFMLCVFAGAYALAYFMRRGWI